MSVSVTALQRDPRVAAYVRLSGREVFPVDGARLETPPARDLWRWWQAIAARAVPTRADFDVVEHPGLAAHLYLIERIEGGFRLRLAGESFERMFQRRKGHEWLSHAPEPLARAFAGYFDFVVEAGEPFHSIGRLHCGWSDWFTFESLICPLRQDGGADQLLGVAAQSRQGCA